MFMLYLPADAGPEGSCRINGQDTKYKMDANSISYRHAESEPWQTRNILERRPMGGPENLVLYLCDDGPNVQGPYRITEPVAGPDGSVTPRTRTIGGEGPKAEVLAPAPPLGSLRGRELREHLLDCNLELLARIYREQSAARGTPDVVLLVLDLRDEGARRVAEACMGAEAVRRHLGGLAQFSEPTTALAHLPINRPDAIGVLSRISPGCRTEHCAPAAPGHFNAVVAADGANTYFLATLDNKQTGPRTIR